MMEIKTENPYVSHLNRIRNSPLVEEYVSILNSMGVDFDAPYFDDLLYREHCRSENCTDADYYPITIYYKELLIQNNSSRELKVYDTYVRMYVSEAPRLVMRGRSPLKVIRTTASKGEFVRGYIHSHPGSGMSFTHFNEVCAGSGPVNTILSLTNYTPRGDKFRAFVVAIKAFLEFENNGGSYNEIRRVIEMNAMSAGSATTPLRVRIGPQHENAILKELAKDKSIKVSISNGDIKIDFDNNSLVRIVGMFSDSMILNMNSTGEYYESSKVNVPTRAHVLVYRGEKKFLRARTSEESMIPVVHPELVETLKAHIKRKIIKKLNGHKEIERDKADIV